MKRRFTYIVFVGALVLMIFTLFLWTDREPPATVQNTANPQDRTSASSRQASEVAAEPTTQPEIVEDAPSEVALIAKVGRIKPEDQETTPHPDFVWYTSPTSNGTIKDSKGGILFQATDEMPFSSLRSKTGVPFIVVVSGNRNAFVIDMVTKEQVKLPTTPPGIGMKGFETWKLIDDKTLLGLYYVPTLKPDGKPVGCCEGHNIAETKLYAYNLKSKSMAEVVLPKALKGTAFSVGRIANDGSVEIVGATTHLGGGGDIGWFNLSTHK
jgi:hypothetical protein